MAQEGHDIATELLAVAEKLTSLARRMTGEITEIPVSHAVLEEIAKKMAAGKCLQCEKVKHEKYRRGICPACYRRSVLKIDDGLTSWRELQSKGLASPKSQGGRPSELTALDKLIIEKKVAMVAADIPAAMAKLDAKKKAREKR